MSKFNIYKAKNLDSHSSVNDYKSIIAAEIFWTIKGKQGYLNQLRAVVPKSKNETYEAANGDLIGSLELDDASITEWFQIHKEIVGAIDTLQEVHDDGHFRCVEAINTINKHRDSFAGNEDFYDKVDEYEVPIRRPWIPMEMDYRGVLHKRYNSQNKQ